MKYQRVLRILFCIAMMISLTACSGEKKTEERIPQTEEAVQTSETEPKAPPAYIREIETLSMDTFLEELGTGYTCSALIGFDTSVRYDDYQAIPVYFQLHLRSTDSDEYSSFWRWCVRMGETEAVEFTLNELPVTPEGVAYDIVGAYAQAISWEDVSAVMQIENARIILPDGKELSLEALNGTFSASMTFEEEPFQGQSWLTSSLDTEESQAEGHVELPDAATLQQSVFRADVTLLEAEGPSKTEYYYNLSIGNPPEPTEAWFRFLKEEGFDTIRFRVTWFNHTNDETYEIDREWLEQVEKVLRLALDAGMYCSINLNWDCFGDNASDFLDEEDMRNMAFDVNWLQPSGEAAVEERFAAVWTQIAEYFRDYDEHLFFESINEPTVSGNWADKLGVIHSDRMGHWKTLGAAEENLNRLNQIFVDSVRATGGNNAQRVLVVTPYFSRGWEDTLREFVLPEDPAGHTMVGVNFYQTEENPENTIAAMEKYLVEKGIPVIMLEFGSSENEWPEEERLAWLETVVPQLRAWNTPIIWYADHWGQHAGHPLQDSPYFCLYNPYTWECAYPEFVSLLIDSEK